MIIKRNLSLVISILVSLVVIFAIIINNDNIREDIYDVTLGKVFNDDMKTILDSRTGETTLAAYQKFLKSSDVFTGRGIGFMKKYGILSDIRGLIFKFGIIGFSLIIIILFLILWRMNKFLLILFLPNIILIITHRSWMFESVNIFLLSILAIGSVAYKKEI